MAINDYIARYNLDETSGTTCVDTTGNYNGTYTNSPTLNQTGAYGTSKGVAFASASSQAVMTGSIDLSGTQKVTVAMWVKTSATSGNLLELSTNYNSVSDSFCLLISGANALQFGVKGNSGYNTSEVTTTLDGTWKHVVVVMDTTVAAANQVVPYINGVAASYSKALSNANSNAFGNRAVYIASRAASSVFLSGTIDDVRIYNRALNAGEVAELYAYNGGARLTDGLCALWEFREAAGATSVADISGNGNTLTLTSGAAVSTGPFTRLQGATFDGTDDYGASSTAGAVLRSGATNDLTIAAWLRFNTDGRNDFAVWKSADASDDVSLYVNASNQIECWCSIDGVAATMATSATTLTSGSTWYHVGVAKWGDAWQIYINGAADGSAGSSAKTLANHGTDVFWIGSNHDASFLPLAANDLDGKLAQVGVWNRALSAAEFAQLYNSGAGLVYPFTTPGGVVGRFGFGFDFGF